MVIDNLVFNINSSNKINKFEISIDQSFPTINSINNKINGQIELNWIFTELLQKGSFYKYYINLKKTGTWSVNNGEAKYSSLADDCSNIHLKLLENTIKKRSVGIDFLKKPKSIICFICYKFNT